MIQEILVALIFIAAMAWLARLLYRQMTASKREGQACDKCVPKQTVNRK